MNEACYVLDSFFLPADIAASLNIHETASRNDFGRCDNVTTNLSQIKSRSYHVAKKIRRSHTKLAFIESSLFNF